MEVLFTKIAALHGVRTDDVIDSASKRDEGVDFAFVFLPMAVFFVFFTYRLCGRMFQAIDARSSAIIVAFIDSILVSACGVLVGELWALAVETIRIGNNHLSFRTARIPWSNQRGYVFAVGLVLFWITAALRYHWTGRSLNSPHSDLRGRSQPGLE